MPSAEVPLNLDDWGHLSEELREPAARLSAQLAREVLDARSIVHVLGHSADQAVALIERFKPYIVKQRVAVAAAAAEGRWAPEGGSQDRTQKTLRGLAHATKGAAGMIAAHRMVDACKRLQDACEATRAEGANRETAIILVKAAHEVWMVEVDALLDALREHDIRALVERPSPLLR